MCWRSPVDSCYPQSGHRCIYLTTGWFIYTYIPERRCIYRTYQCRYLWRLTWSWYIYICVCYTYTSGLSTLPDVYAQVRGPQAQRCMRIYQTKHKCLWYKCYVLHCLCRVIAGQYELKDWIYYIDSLGNSIMQAATTIIPTFINKNGQFQWKCGMFL